jgi:hypothetical protein
MKRLRNSLVGVDQGSTVIFSDFANNGPMWSGEGPREASVEVTFTERFRSIPAVHVSMSMWDTSGSINQRADLRAEDVSETGFFLVFRTWGDSKIARVRGDWMAIGELSHDDDWKLY